MNTESSSDHVSDGPVTSGKSAAGRPDERRGFFVRFLAGAIGLFVGVVPFAAGLTFFMDPLLRKRQADDADGSSSSGTVKDADGFVKMNITLDALPSDGSPRAFKVYDDRVDAWNKFQNIEIGTVWLRRTPDNQVLAFSSICPHLGCAVDFRQAENDFYCPCHTSSFDLDGEKTNAIPPRGMDRLAVKVDPQADNAVWLKYEEFRGATPNKIPVT